MNSKEFIQSMRKLIREEVQLAVRTELNKFKSTITESTRSVTKTAPVVAKPKSSAYSNSLKPKLQYTSNSMLNDLLNETAAHPFSGPIAYQEEQINYNDFSEWPTMNNNVAPRMPNVITDINGARVDVNQLKQTEAGAAVVDAITKDYSALMKAIDKKKGK